MIAFIGAGGHCRSCIDAAESSGLEIGGIVDPNTSVHTYGYPWLGDDNWLGCEESYMYQWVVTIGQINTPSIRKNIFEKLVLKNLVLGRIVSKSAYVSSHSMIGEGSVILNMALINGSTHVGKNCIINSKALIEHDCVIEDHCHISTGVLINGGTTVGTGCFIGSGSVLSHGINIVSGCTIGIGSVVRNDITEPGVWVGNPLRKVK